MFYLGFLIAGTALLGEFLNRCFIGNELVYAAASKLLETLLVLVTVETNFIKTLIPPATT